MSHADTVKHLSKETGLSQSLVKTTLESLTGLISEKLKSEGKFEFKDIGTLSVIETAERQGRNPSTGKSMVIPAGKRVKLKVSKTLKDAVA